VIFNFDFRASYKKPCETFVPFRKFEILKELSKLQKNNTGGRI